MREYIASTVIALSLFFILLYAFFRFAGPIPFTINSVATTKSDSFSVTGEGKSSMKPDTAYITAGVTANGATVKEVQDKMNTAINKVSQVIKQLGVDEKDIQTTNYNVNPNYDYNTGGQRITGYQASTNLSIKVRDITKSNAVIDAATANGANQIYGITFDVADKEKAENEARENAVEDAKEKAQQAAKIAGFRLGKIVNYTENFGGGYPVPMMGRALDTAELKAAPPTQVEPGSQEIKVSVTLSYEVR